MHMETRTKWIKETGGESGLRGSNVWTVERRSQLWRRNIAGQDFSFTYDVIVDRKDGDKSCSLCGEGDADCKMVFQIHRLDLCFSEGLNDGFITSSRLRAVLALSLQTEQKCAEREKVKSADIPANLWCCGMTNRWKHKPKVKNFLACPRNIYQWTASAANPSRWFK